MNQKKLSFILLLLLMLLSSFLVLLSAESAFAQAVPLSESDLIVDENDTLVIEKTTYVCSGNIVVKDFGMLLIRDAALQLSLEYDWQYNITVMGNGNFVLQNGSIKMNRLAGLFLRNMANLTSKLNSRIEVHNFTVTDDPIVMLDTTTINVVNLEVLAEEFVASNSEINVKPYTRHSSSSLTSDYMSFHNSTLEYNQLLIVHQMWGGEFTFSLSFSTSSLLISHSTIRISIHVAYEQYTYVSTSLTVTGTSSVSITHSSIESSSSGSTWRGTDTAVSSLSITSPSVFLSNSVLKCEAAGDEGSTFVSSTISSSELTAEDTIFINYGRGADPYRSPEDEPVKFVSSETSVGYFCNVTFPSITLDENVTILNHKYLTTSVIGESGDPVPWAKVTVLHFLNESLAMSGETDTGGQLKLPLLAEVCTSLGQNFVGNYKVNASCYYSYYAVPHHSSLETATMTENVALTLTLPATIYPVIIDQAFVSNQTCYVGHVQSVGFHALWARNNSAIVGGSIYVNETEYVTNGTGWIQFDVTSEASGKSSWTITNVSCSGVTSFSQTCTDPFIIWAAPPVPPYDLNLFYVVLALLVGTISIELAYLKYKKYRFHSNIRTLNQLERLVKEREKIIIEEASRLLGKKPAKVKALLTRAHSEGKIQGLFTLDEREFITEEKLEEKIRKTLERKGRITFGKIAAELNVETDEIREFLRELQKRDRVRGAFTLKDKGFITEEKLKEDLMRRLENEEGKSER